MLKNTFLSLVLISSVAFANEEVKEVKSNYTTQEYLELAGSGLVGGLILGPLGVIPGLVIYDQLVHDKNEKKSVEKVKSSSEKEDIEYIKEKISKL